MTTTGPKQSCCVAGVLPALQLWTLTKLSPASAETLESHNSISCLCFVNSLMINSWRVRSPSTLTCCCCCVVVTLKTAHFSCVNQQKLFRRMGVGSCNKAALCLMNLSHKYQLASRYATKTETYTESARRIWTCCHTSSTMWHKHLILSPGRFVPTPPVPQTQSRPTPDWMWCTVWGQDGCNSRRLLLPIFTSLS